MTYLFAFLHHVAAFTLAAALVVEFVLTKGELTLANAQRIRVADIVFGASAGVLVVVGLMRVFFFEKGATYYFQSETFIAKLSLFVLVGLISIYPTIEFMSWGKFLRQGQLPGIDPQRLRAVRAVIHLELAGVVFIILFAVLMARGVGYVG